MKGRSGWRGVLWCAGMIVLCASVVAVAGEPPKTAHKGQASSKAKAKPSQPLVTARVHGELLDLEGVRVLRVWGTPTQRGHAHGCLLGKELVTLLDQFLQSGLLGGTVEGYEKKVLPALRMMKIAPRYQAEMRGILAGVETIHGGPVTIPSLKRPLMYEDIAAINCVPDLSRLACSSFAAWGALTPNGETIVGRNLDWHVVPALANTSLVMVHMPSGETQRVSWVSLTWPGLIICTTGFNTDGVVVSMHDAPGESPTEKKGFTPRGFALRDLVESAREKTAFEQAGKILRDRTGLVGNNVMVCRPSAAKKPAALVFEYDGNEEHDGGVTIREPNQDSGADRAVPCIACTNHFRKRAEPQAGDRYKGIHKALMSAKAAKKQMTLDDAWMMLRDVAFPRGKAKRIVTHHSAVFEPNQRRMHIAFSEGGKPAPMCRKITLDLATLFGEMPVKPAAK